MRYIFIAYHFWKRVVIYIPSNLSLSLIVRRSFLKQEWGGSFIFNTPSTIGFPIYQFTYTFLYFRTILISSISNHEQILESPIASRGRKKNFTEIRSWRENDGNELRARNYRRLANSYGWNIPYSHIRLQLSTGNISGVLQMHQPVCIRLRIARS